MTPKRKAELKALHAKAVRVADEVRDILNEVEAVEGNIDQELANLDGSNPKKAMQLEKQLGEYNEYSATLMNASDLLHDLHKIVVE